MIGPYFEFQPQSRWINLFGLSLLTFDHAGRQDVCSEISGLREGVRLFCCRFLVMGSHLCCQGDLGTRSVHSLLTFTVGLPLYTWRVGRWPRSALRLLFRGNLSRFWSCLNADAVASPARGRGLSAGVCRERADQLFIWLYRQRHLPNQRPVWTAASFSRSVSGPRLPVHQGYRPIRFQISALCLRLSSNFSRLNNPRDDV